MSDNVIQTSFSSGELAPSIFARTNLEQYHSGAATMKNWFVDYRSGASTRAGTRFIKPAFKPQTRVKLYRYQYSTDQSFVLEFGDGYVQFVKNGATVLEGPQAITSITQANPGVVTLAAPPGWATGDWVYAANIGGMSSLNNRFYSVLVSGASITLRDVNSHAIDTSGLPAYTGGGSLSRVYTLVSPYASADLGLLKVSQTTTTMYLTHPLYAPRTLTRVTDTAWAFTTLTFGSAAVPPGAPTVTGSAVGAATYGFVITSVDASGNESAPSPVGSTTNLVNILTTAGTIFASWGAAAGAIYYNVYMAEPVVGAAIPAGAAFGYVGTVTDVNFANTNIAPDFSTTPPVAKNPFVAGNNPGCSAFFQQRQVYAGTRQFPLRLDLSQPGLPNNFDVSNPVQDDDAIQVTLVSSQVNAVKSLVAMPGGLLAMTSGGAWQISGGQANVGVTPANIVATPQAYHGASDVPPLVIGSDILYIQAKGSIVRKLGYNFYANIYASEDLSIFSNHLFFGQSISEWAYAEEPFKIIWAVRTDGILLSMTYVNEQKITGWAQHNTQGLFKSVVAVSEGAIDATYFVIRRYIQGAWTQFIERMVERTFTYNAEDAWSVDAGIQSVGIVPNGTLTVTGDAATYGAIVNFTSSIVIFSPGSVGEVIRVAGGNATITAFVGPNSVDGRINYPMTSPDANAGAPIFVDVGGWALATPRTVYSGLDYLEGETVAIVADGSVVPQQVVTDGTITLQVPATNVTLGLPYTCDLQTMPLDVGEPTIQGKRKKVAALNILCAFTRGLSAGSDFNHLTDLKEMNESVPIDSFIPLVTGQERIVMDPAWTVPGQIAIRQANPMPATVLGVVPEIVIGDTNK